MGSRLKLQEVLEDILGSKNVYFQPPQSIQMSYPCIVYEKVRINTRFADNRPYNLNNVYQLTYIDKNPDSDMPTKIAQLPQCVFERAYDRDNLHYYSFRLTF